MIKVKFCRGIPSCAKSVHKGPAITFDDLISLYRQCKERGISAKQAEIFEAGFVFGANKPRPSIRDRDMAFQMVYGLAGKDVVDEEERRAEEWRLGDDFNPVELLEGTIDTLRRGMYIADIEDALSKRED